MYWQGPTWINTNWMIAEGLDRYGEAAPARELRERSLTMVAESGYYEYFSAITGDGYGAPDFSWTAALVLDLLAKLSR
jgi:glycogen debranching enzyme